MDDILRDLGFDDKETQLYLALLKLGPSSVGALLQHTKIERRTIYDVLERLIQKGKASYFEEQKTRKYTVVSPEQLLADLVEKQEKLKSELKKFQDIKHHTQQARVEILKGVQGLKEIYNEIIYNKQTHLVYGDISPLNEIETYRRPTLKFLQRMEEEKLKEKVLLVKAHNLKKRKGGTYKEVSEDFSFPAPTIIYGTTVVQFIYTDPITIIKITSKEVADTHKSYFNYFWKQAE